MTGDESQGPEATDICTCVNVDGTGGSWWGNASPEKEAVDAPDNEGERSDDEVGAGSVSVSVSGASDVSEGIINDRARWRLLCASTKLCPTPGKPGATPRSLNVAARGVGSSSEMVPSLVTKSGHVSILSQTSSSLVNAMPISPDSL